MSDVPPPPSDPPPPSTAPADSPGAQDPAAAVAPADAPRPAESAGADSAIGRAPERPGAVDPDAGAETAGARAGESQQPVNAATADDTGTAGDAQKAADAQKAEAEKAIEAEKAHARKAIEAEKAEAERRDGAHKGGEQRPEPPPTENGHKPPDVPAATEPTADHVKDTADLEETADELIAEAEDFDLPDFAGELADATPDLLEHVTHAPMGPIPGVKEGVSWATSPAVWQMTGVYANVYAGRLATGINDVRARIFPKK